MGNFAFDGLDLDEVAARQYGDNPEKNNPESNYDLSLRAPTPNHRKLQNSKQKWLAIYQA